MAGGDRASSSDQHGASAEAAPFIPGHELIRRIANGSYGEVWLARTELGAFRAVKIIRRANFKNTRPFDREFGGIQRYEPNSREHEGLIDILQVGSNEVAGYFYYVMELADDASSDNGEWTKREKAHHATMPESNVSPVTYTSRTLAHEIQRRGRLPINEVIELGISLARALEFLHSRRLVHRDIKPANIIYAGGRPKLADVGLIANLGDPQTLVGTEGYYPPGESGTAQADLYSLGKVLYEAATGNDRQEFPDLALQLDAETDPALLELNEVLLKACESDPRSRYETTAAMAEDLERLKAGQSLRLRRARQKQIRAATTVSVLLTGVLVIGAGLVVSIQNGASKPQQLVQDDFEQAHLNTNLWGWSHEDYGIPGKGRRQFQVEQSGGELVLQSRAEHEDGDTAAKSTWVDLKRDLRPLAPCRIEMEIAGRAYGGGFTLAIVDASSQPRGENPNGARLSEFRVLLQPKPMEFPAVRMRIDLLPTSQAAVVYPDIQRLDEFDVVDLRGLAAWQLRLHCFAITSSGLPTAQTDLRIRELVVSTNPDGDWIAGRVVNEKSLRSLADAVIASASGRTLAKTHANGAFILPRNPELRDVSVKRAGFLPTESRFQSDVLQPGLMTVHLRKMREEFGDVVEAIPYGNLSVQDIGFRGDTLTVLVQDSLTASRLLPVDLVARSIVAGETRAKHLFFPDERLVIGFVEYGSRLIGFKYWKDAAIFDLNAEPPQLILKLALPQDGKPIFWPKGAAFDGEFLWFVEKDDTNQRYGLHAIDLLRGELTRTLTSTEKGLSGLAWDGKRFWISTTDGKVTEIDRAAALSAGTVEAGRGRQFDGHYARLAHGQGFLWGLDTEKRLLCKVKITD